MSRRLFGGFALVVVVLFALGARATAQRKPPVASEGVVPLNFNSNSNFNFNSNSNFNFNSNSNPNSDFYSDIDFNSNSNANADVCIHICI